MSLPEKPPTVPTPILGQPGVYDVPSDTTPGTVYRVDTTGTGSCSCPGYAHRGHCKHMDRMRDIEDRQARTRAMARTVTLPRTLAVTADRCCQCSSNVVMWGTSYCAFCAPGVLDFAAGAVS